MAASVYAIWEVRSQGSDNNSGCFDPNSTMTSTLSSSNGTSATPTVTASNYTFTSSDIGYYLFIKSGTSWTPGWYQITSISSGSAIVNATSGQVVKLNRRRSSVNGIGTTDNLASGNWAIDYSQNNNNRILFTDLTLNSTTTCSSSANPFTPAMIGNTIRITAGTNFTAQVFVITSLSGSIAQLDRTAGTSGATNGTAYLGGAMQNPYNAFFDYNYVAGSTNFIYIKADGEYTWGTQTFLAGNGYVNIFGYENYRHDSGRPTLSFNQVGARYFGRGDGNSTKVRNIIADSKELYNCYLVYNGNNQPYSTITNCIFKNYVLNGASGLSYRLSAFDVARGAIGSHDFGTLYNFIPNTTYYGGISGGLIGINTSFKNCLLFLGHFSATNGMWQNTGQIGGGMVIKNNLFVNGRSGIMGAYENFNNFGNHGPVYFYNNLIINNPGTIFSFIGGYSGMSFVLENNYLFNCGAIGATTSLSHNSSRALNINNVVLSSSPFKDYVNYDFRLNDDANGGRLVKFDTIPLLLSPSNTSKNKDVGSIQNNISSIKINMNGGMRG